MHHIIDIDSRRRRLWLAAAKKYLLGLSDQQLLATLALQLVSVIKLCELSRYHLVILTSMASSGSASYSISVAVLQEEVRRRRALATARAVLTVLSGLIFAAQMAIVIVGASEVQSAQAFVCLQRSAFAPQNEVNLVFYGLYIAVPILLFTTSTVTALVPALWPFGDETSDVLHSVNEPKEGFSLTILLTWVASSVSIWKLCNIAQALGGSTELKLVEGTRETDWTFGQILPVVMLLSPVTAAIQALLGRSESSIRHFSRTQTRIKIKQYLKMTQTKRTRLRIETPFPGELSNALR